MGISTQRASFITWRKDTGVPFHNFITWKDLRADDIVKAWDKSVTVNFLKFFSYCLYLTTRNQRYLAGSKLRISNLLVTFRLLWAIKNIPELKKCLEKNNVMFGTIETWLIYKFTKGKTYVTDISNASATGLYDPFLLQWNTLCCLIFDIPMKILPKVVNCDYDFGFVDKEILGTTIPINCVMSDQSASLFGSCCFHYGNVKLTMGTGSFLNVNTGCKAYGSHSEVYPLVAWKMNDGDTIFMQETSSNDTGSLIEWIINTELIKNAPESSEIAESAQGNNGVYFIPAFSGFWLPINDPNATSGFIGVTPTSTKCHLVRAVLESIVFQIYLMVNVMIKERVGKFKKIRVDGGVSKNDFILSSLASILDMEIERTISTEMSVQGVTYVAGIKAGLWTKEYLSKLPQDKTFTPDLKKRQYFKKEFETWMRAVERFTKWN
ncbi:putative glycerol kinase 5 isoform X2 [Agrilus planipennis]|nr:putative glycerol kinase 5 isoform X2 [Agrilus planipennis]XP_025835699.1 putative glycerol kinase 5 isoform X2 [Agrilus planipennis]